MMETILNAMGTQEAGWVLIIAQFFAVEFKALFNKEKGDTWSEVLRYVFGFSKRAKGSQGWWMIARRGSFYALATWFTVHIGLGW